MENPGDKSSLSSKSQHMVEEFMRPDDKLLSRKLLSSHISRYAFAAQFVAGKVVLDVACGSGYGTGYLADKGAERVIGGDISQSALKYANAYFKKENTDFIYLDASKELPFHDEYFDVLVSMETIEHLLDAENFLAECRRVLKSEGVFICSTMYKERNPPGKEKLATPANFEPCAV